MAIEGFDPVARESFGAWLADGCPSSTVDDSAPAPLVRTTREPAGGYSEETWGLDDDAQARQAAAMSLFGGARG